jgi:methyl-galactoside transport system permease protein
MAEEKKVAKPAAKEKAVVETPKAPVKKEDESPVDTDPEIAKNVAELESLRKDGTLKIYQLKEEMYDVKRKQMIDEVTRKKIITADQKATADARVIEKQNKPRVDELVKATVARINEVSKPYEAQVKAEGKQAIEEAKPGHEERLTSLKEQYQNSLVQLKAANAQKEKEFEAKKQTSENAEERDALEKQFKRDFKALKEEDASEIDSLKVTYKSSVADENNAFGHVKAKARENDYAAYTARYNKINDVRNGHLTIIDNLEHRWKSYLNTFNWTTFLLGNALYIVVILFFIACFVISPIIGKGNILTPDNIYGFLETASSRMFFALGVAGLIVLGGTDLSVGRLIGLGTLCVGFMLHDGEVPAQIFKHAINLNSMALPTRVILALLLSVFATTLFSAIAGFFSAKFKMHPFITTLSTMMIIYGLMYVATDGVPTGNPNVGGINQTILGRFDGGFPKYVIYAVIAIAVVWFIWNKTTFGKNMFAVGGNPEAASVSGISYFKVTLGVFIMAGVLYGFGTFFYAFYSNPAANTGYGYELDAIAACVVGGISFFGGIGKVKGAVIGCLIFAGLTYVLTIMGVSSYWQFVIKGLILMSAVALDSLKYLKKK